MPGNRKNLQLFTYVDDNGLTWNKRGEDGGAAAAVDGHAAFTPAAPTWDRESRRMHVRKIIYTDPASFRTVKPIFYTAAAYAAVALGDVISVAVPGVAVNVNYAASEKVPEKQPGQRAARQLID